MNKQPKRKWQTITRRLFFTGVLAMAGGGLSVNVLSRTIMRSGRYQGPVSDHFDGEKFFNPGASTGKGFLEFLRWQTAGGWKEWPKWVENKAKPRLPSELRSGDAAITFINHCTFLVQFPGLNVITDPVYSERASPVQWSGPKRVRQPGLAWDDLPRIDVVLVSHDHYDHMDMPTLKRLNERFQPFFITTLGNKELFEYNGLKKVEELDWWQQSRFAGNGKITLTQAQHWSGRGIGSRNRNRTLWGGFFIEASGSKVFFAGDTGYGTHFTQIREKFGPIDVAMLPIGAYEPRWFMRDAHMNPDDAVQAHRDLGAKLSVATHYGTFRLTNEAFDDPLKDLAASLKSRSVDPKEFKTLEVGETFLVKSARA